MAEMHMFNTTVLLFEISLKFFAGIISFSTLLTFEGKKNLRRMGAFLPLVVVFAILDYENHVFFRLFFPIIIIAIQIGIHTYFENAKGE